MKRVTAIAFLLVLLVIFNSTYNYFEEPAALPPHVLPPVAQNTPEPAGTPRPQDDIVQTPEPTPDAIIYQPGVYVVGVDIPAGVYMATNDDSDASQVIVKSSFVPNTEKPNIIITARYLTGRGEFEGRPTYSNAVSRGGGIPILPDDDEELAKILREGLVEYAEMLAEQYDGLILSGGGDVAAHFFNQEHHPASNPPDEILDAAELALCRAFIALNKPVLGICRGMQVLNIAMGGELIQDIPALLNLKPGIHNTHNGKQARHIIDIVSGTWLYDLVGSQIEVNSFHHQCVDGVAAGFTVAARAGIVIEAMERGNALGVQFHPERMLDEGMLPLFEDFIERCLYDYTVFYVLAAPTLIELAEGQYIEVINASLQKVN
ncbi:MAG: gamma-glutamyl-gamma-aminobutyrate hydrolase family protein [Oscillospiraceae bacterium]|nr:gamma-glutamyl-gamma-aminobutyrate hydrolase family protein [Oscillospiraceae bacterium]